MGEGRNAVFLAKNGFDVDGCDVSDKAIEKSKLLARESGVTLNAFAADLEEYKIPANTYDLVTCFYYSQRGPNASDKGWLEKGWDGHIRDIFY